MIKKVLVFILAFASVMITSVISVSPTTTPLAFADDTKSDIIIKDNRNHEYCRLNAIKTTCDLSDYKVASPTTDDSEESTSETSDNGAEKVSGVLTLDDVNNYTLSLSKVNAPSLILSVDDPITIKSKDGDNKQIFGSIIQTESTASTIFEEGNFSFISKDGIAVKTAGRLALKHNAHISAVGKSNAIHASEQLLTDSDTSIDASSTADNGEATVITAKSIETNTDTTINITNDRSKPTTSDDSSENATDDNTAGVEASAKSTATITAISTLNGGMITLKQTKLNISDVSKAISTYSASSGLLSTNKAGDVFIQGGSTNLSNISTAGINANSVKISDNANVKITSNDSVRSIQEVGIGAIYDVNINSSNVDISSSNGIITNGSLKVADNSKLNINAFALGISVCNNFDQSGVSQINISPIPLEDNEQNQALLAVNRTIATNGFIALFYGGNANFSLIDDDLVGFNGGGKILSGTPNSDLVLHANEYQSILNSAVTAADGEGIDVNSKFYLKLNTTSGNIEATTYAVASKTPELNISDTTKLADGENISFKPILEDSTLFIAYDGANIATKLTILPKPINILVKLFYSHTLIFCLIVLLILLLLATIIAIIIYKKTHRRALFLMYLQNDMMESGPMRITDADNIAANIERYITKYHKKFKQVYLVRGWHKIDNELFDKWPKHNIQNTFGAGFVGNLESLAKEHKFEVINAGVDDNGYNVIDDGVKKKLVDNKINYIYFAGNTLDYSILKSSIVASDLMKKNHVIVLSNLVSSISKDVLKIKQKLREKHIRIL